MRQIAGLRTAAAVFAASAAFSAAASEVGRFAVVQNRVTTLKPGAADAVPASVGASVVLDEEETTAGSSAATLTIGEGAVISLGENTRFRVSREVVDRATGAKASILDLAIGKARIFVSRFWSGRPEVRVETPTAVVGIKGSEVVVEVERDGETTVTVLLGSAEVGERGAAGPVRALARGERTKVVRLSGSGAVEKVRGEEIERLRAATEPVPEVPPLADRFVTVARAAVPMGMAALSESARNPLTCAGRILVPSLPGRGQVGRR